MGDSEDSFKAKLVSARQELGQQFVLSIAVSALLTFSRLLPIEGLIFQRYGSFPFSGLLEEIFVWGYHVSDVSGGVLGILLLVVNASFPFILLVTKKTYWLCVQGAVLFLLYLLVFLRSFGAAREVPDAIYEAAYVSLNYGYGARDLVRVVLVLGMSVALIAFGLAGLKSSKPATSGLPTNFGMPMSDQSPAKEGVHPNMEFSEPSMENAGADATQPNNTEGQSSAGSLFGSDVRFIVQMFGADDRTFSYPELQQMSQAGLLKPTMLVQQVGSTFVMPASSIPGVFSDKSVTTAVLLGFFFGTLGVDRFYLGHTGLGVLKLLTLGGCGIWAIIDIILIASRKVTDSDGRPLV